MYSVAKSSAHIDNSHEVFKQKRSEIIAKNLRNERLINAFKTRAKAWIGHADKPKIEVSATNYVESKQPQSKTQQPSQGIGQLTPSVTPSNEFMNVKRDQAKMAYVQSRHKGKSMSNLER